MKKGLLALVCALSFTGCATPLRNTKEYNLLSPVSITLQEPNNLSEEYKALYHRDALGWADLGRRKVVVPYSNDKDNKGNYLPNFEILGKEIWHMKELGGLYHD